MTTIRLPTEFKELLSLLNFHEVRYLIVGGYAVGFHGYPRATGDIDIWVETKTKNAEKILDVLKKFGFNITQINKKHLLSKKQIIRMGNPPLRIEILTSISGVFFEECYSEAINAVISDINVPFINLKHLLLNKKAAGRLKDLNDVEQLSGHKNKTSE